MNTAFTPGPWEYDGNGRVDAVAFRKMTTITDDDGTVRPYVQGLVALPYTCGDGTHLPNALLIAAAPELLEALIEMEREKSDYMQRNKLGDPSKEHTNKMARAAIAKATGSTT